MFNIQAINKEKTKFFFQVYRKCVEKHVFDVIFITFALIICPLGLNQGSLGFNVFLIILNKTTHNKLFYPKENIFALFINKNYFTYIK